MKVPYFEFTEVGFPLPCRGYVPRGPLTNNGHMKSGYLTPPFMKRAVSTTLQLSGLMIPCAKRELQEMDFFKFCGKVDNFVMYLCHPYLEIFFLSLMDGRMEATKMFQTNFATQIIF